MIKTVHNPNIRGITLGFCFMEPEKTSRFIVGLVSGVLGVAVGFAAAVLLNRIDF